MSSNDWKDSIGALERMKNMLESGYEWDVEFLVGNEEMGMESIKAHKCVLGTISVFEAQFRANKANGLPSNEPIKVIDVEPSAFKAMLKFIYSDDLSGINKTNIAYVLATAKKYLLTAFAKKCVELAFEFLDVENALGLLKVAEFYQEKVLAEHCQEFVDQEIKNIVASDEFLLLNKDEIKELFERDTHWGDELALFNGLDRWAHKQCRDKNIENPTGEQKRAAMGSALKAIRFPLINVEDFNNKIALTNILTGDELEAIFLHKSEKTNAETKARISLPFSDKRRSNPLNKWNAKDCGQELKISRSGLEVEHFGGEEWNSVRSKLPIPKFNSDSPSVAYFEVEFLKKSDQYIYKNGTGFGTKHFPLEGNVGRENYVIGICSKGGIQIGESFSNFEDAANTYFDTGEVVGLGIAHSPANSPLKWFATCNGKLLGMAELPAKFADLELFPMVHLRGSNSIRANFGQNEWRFNPEQLRQ